MRIMYDSVNVNDIPLTGAQLIGCYSDGSFDNAIAAAKRFPHLVIVPIDVNGSNPKARVLDYEPGDVQNPATAGQWVKESRAAGNDWPTVYCDRSEMVNVINGVSATGLVLGKEWWLWISTLDMTWQQFQGVTGVAAVQYQDYENLYDVSVVLNDSWLAPPPKPVATGGPVDCTIAWQGADGPVSRKALVLRASWDTITWQSLPDCYLWGDR